MAPSRLSRSSVQADAGRGLRFHVEPVLLGVRDVRRGGPRRLRLFVRRFHVRVIAVEETRAEVGVARDLPVHGLEEPEVVVLLVDRGVLRRVGAEAVGLLRRPVQAVVAQEVPAVVLGGAVDLRVDEHLALGRGRHAGDDRGDPGRVGKALVDGHVSRGADPEPAGRAVGEHRRGGDHPLLVVVGRRRGWRRLVAPLADQVEEVLGRQRHARLFRRAGGLLRGPAPAGPAPTGRAGRCSWAAAPATRPSTESRTAVVVFTLTSPASRRSWLPPRHGLLHRLEDRLHLALADRALERVVVLLVLVGVGHRERRDRPRRRRRSCPCTR